MSLPSNAVLTRARVARRAVALMLVVAGVVACVLSVADISGGAVGETRFFITTAFLVLGPGWSAAGFLRRAPAAHVWLLTLGVGVSTTLLVGQIMVMVHWWHPAVALYAITVVCIPFLLRHAVVAQ